MYHKVFFILVGIFLGALAFESALWFIGLPKIYQPRTTPMQFAFLNNPEAQASFVYLNKENSKIKFVYDGNSRGYFEQDNSVTHSTNSAGFRGSEFLVDRKPNTIRLAFLGDSFTFGEGVKDSDTFTAKICAKLERLNPENSFECYNFGVGGYNTTQSVELFQRIALAFKPDYTILSYILNDAEETLYVTDPATKQFKRRDNKAEFLVNKTLPSNWLLKSKLAQLIWQRSTNMVQSKNSETYYHSLYQQDQAGWIATQAAILKFSQICHTTNSACLGNMIPLLFNLENYPFKAEHKTIRSTFAQSGVGILDLLPVFSAFTGPELWVHPTDSHPNEIAHEIIAEQLVKFFNQRKFFSAPIT